ncbi:hypothetical protein Tco_0465791 [Tanacetum coccineum]
MEETLLVEKEKARAVQRKSGRTNGDTLRKCILEGPYTPFTVIIPAVLATDNSLVVHEQRAVKTVLNMSPENKAHFESEKEAIHLILTGIGDEIYSTVDACKTAHEVWEAIERLQQGESLNIQDVKTNLFWEFGKFTSHDGETMESYYSRFYKLMNEMIRNNLTVATMQEVNEIRAKRITKNANLLALVATAQTYQDPYYQAPKSHKSYAPTSKASLPTRSHATIRHKGKEIAKPITPPSESISEEDNDPEQAQKDKEMQKNLALIAKKPKRVKDSTYHKEKMLLYKQAEKGVSLQVEQSDWLADTDKEIDEQELEFEYEHVVMNPTSAGMGYRHHRITCKFTLVIINRYGRVIQMNLLDRVSQLYNPFSLSEYLKADNTKSCVSPWKMRQVSVERNSNGWEGLCIASLDGGEYEDKDEDFEDIRRSPYKDKDTEDIRRYS